MKKINLILGITTLIFLLFSCKPVTVMQKDIKHMPVKFKPLNRTEYTLVGELKAEITIAGKISGKKKTLNKEFAKDYKEGLISKTEATDIMYFAPKENEVITGSLYDENIFNNVYGSASIATGKKIGLFQLLFNFRKNIQIRDAGMEFAYFELVKKYPEIDYFINVRFERKNVVSGKTYTETVIVKADGIVLKVD